MNRQPWGITRLAPYGAPARVEGEPVRIDPATQMAVWQNIEGEVIHTAKHRRTVRHKATTTTRSTDGSKPSDTSSDNDTDSTYD